MKFIRYQTSPLVKTAARLRNVGSELDQLLEFAFPALNHFSGGNNFGNDFPLDLYEDQEALVVRAELPGYKKEDLSVEAVDEVLILKAHRKTEARDPDQIAEEQQVRSLPLPHQVDTEKIQARYENGVLTVTLPKREETKPKQITIEVK